MKLGTAKESLAGGVRSGVSVKLTRKGLAALRKALAMRAVDSAGNAASSSRKAALERWPRAQGSSE